MYTVCQLKTQSLTHDKIFILYILAGFNNKISLKQVAFWGRYIKYILSNIYSETLKTPIRKIFIFKIYKTFSKQNEFLLILYHKIDTIMS